MSIKRMSAVWEHSKHKGSELLLLLALADNASDDGFCWPGVEYLAQKIRMTPQSVVNLTSKLEASGELYADHNRRHGNRYLVATGLAAIEIKAAMLRFKYDKTEYETNTKNFLIKAGFNSELKQLFENSFKAAVLNDPSLPVIESSTSVACQKQQATCPPNPADSEHETPAQDSLPLVGSVLKEEPAADLPPVSISDGFKRELGDLFADNPPPAEPPEPPAPNKNAIRAQLEAHFVEKTKLPPPRTKTAKDKRAAGALWWTPLRDIAELVEWDAARAEKLIDLTVDHFRSSKLTIANPNSIVKTAAAILTGNVPGVTMPHVKKLTTYILILPDGTKETVEEYV